MTVTDDEEQAFREEYKRLDPGYGNGSTTVHWCQVCGHEWISWPGSQCPVRGRHGEPDLPPEPEPRITRGEEP